MIPQNKDLSSIRPRKSEAIKEKIREALAGRRVFEVTKTQVAKDARVDRKTLDKYLPEILAELPEERAS